MRVDSWLWIAGLVGSSVDVGWIGEYGWRKLWRKLQFFIYVEIAWSVSCGNVIFLWELEHLDF